MTDINPMWRIKCLTEAFGVCGIGLAGIGVGLWGIDDGLAIVIFGLFGLMQLYYKKGFKNVDKDLYALCGLYVLCLVIYAVFEKVIINYRPVILEEGLEASYPSSHTILAVAFISAAVVEFNARLKAKRVRTVVVSLCILVGIGVVVTRFLSGVHWLTDIVGSILISSACFVLFWGVFNILVNTCLT